MSKEVEDLVSATIFKTPSLVNWALSWDSRNFDTRVANWKSQFSSYEDAKSFFDSFSNTPIDQSLLRRNAAELLVENGWTFEAICKRKS